MPRAGLSCRRGAKFLYFNMIKKILLLIFALSAVFGASAQLGGLTAAPVEEKPLAWSVSVRMTSPVEGTLTITAGVAPGWHLYSTSLPAGGPAPTEFSFAASRGVKFTSPLRPSRAPLSVDDPLFGLRLAWWDADVTFSRTFKVSDPADVNLACSVTFMACNGETCRPPQTVALKAALPARKAK